MPDLTNQVPAGGVDSSTAATPPKPGEVDSSTPPNGTPQQPTDPKLADAVRTRDEAKQRARDAEAKVDALTARVAELETTATELEQLRAENLQLRDERDKRQAADRRAVLERETLRDALPQHVDALRLMLNGLIASGEVKLDAEDIEAAARETRTRLGRNHPTFFGPPEGTRAGGVQGFPARLKPRRSSAI